MGSIADLDGVASNKKILQWSILQGHNALLRIITDKKKMREWLGPFLLRNEPTSEYDSAW